MVVGTDSVHMKEYPHITQKLSEKVNGKSETIYLPGKYMVLGYDFNTIFYLCYILTYLQKYHGQMKVVIKVQK